MIRSSAFLCVCAFLIAVASPGFALETLTLIDFSGDSAETNGITLMGAGFGEYPMPDISFGSIPTDAAFEGATDGQGMIVSAAPGQGVMILTPAILTQNCALLRCSVRLSASHASLYLASVDIGESSYVSTITPNNPSDFVNRYGRIADFFLPPSTGFQGIVQIINTSETDSLTVYLDNLEALDSGLDNKPFPLEDITGGQVQLTPTPAVTPAPVATPTPDSTNSYTVPLDLHSGAKELIMVEIPADTFTMGSPEDERGRRDDLEWLPHQVTLTQDFYIGRYEVTQAQYQAVMHSNSSNFSNKPNNPVEQVSWYDAAEFCNELSRQNGLTPVYDETDWTTDWAANGFRLPTEAEWEYACRAGTQTRFSFGDALEMADTGSSYSEIGDQFMWWHGNNEYNGNVYGTKEVGLKDPNPWSLFDMHGNVWEWCNDWWEFPSNRGGIVDPKGQDSGPSRVVRGGCWYSTAGSCRSVYRFDHWPGTADFLIGFRVVLSRTP